MPPPEFCHHCGELLSICDCDYDEQISQNHCNACGHFLAEKEHGTCTKCDEDMKQTKAAEDACICWPANCDGKSVCGIPCPVHNEDGTVKGWIKTFEQVLEERKEAWRKLADI